MNDEEQKSYSILIILVVLFVLGLIGLAGVLIVGPSGQSSTEQLSRDTSTTSSSSSVPEGISDPAEYVLPDGSALPDNIEKVLVSPGQRVYVYKVPDGFLAEPNLSVVPPAETKPALSGAAVTVEMGCAVSSGSVPDQITIFEDPLEVRVIPVALGHTLGVPCPADEIIETVTLPLEEPIGTRPLVVDGPGTVVNRN